jgi:hypothetical protein
MPTHYFLDNLAKEQAMKSPTEISSKKSCVKLRENIMKLWKEKREDLFQHKDGYYPRGKIQMIQKNGGNGYLQKPRN